MYFPFFVFYCYKRYWQIDYLTVEYLYKVLSMSIVTLSYPKTHWKGQSKFPLGGLKRAWKNRKWDINNKTLCRAFLRFYPRFFYLLEQSTIRPWKKVCRLNWLEKSGKSNLHKLAKIIWTYDFRFFGLVYGSTPGST